MSRSTRKRWLALIWSLALLAWLLDVRVESARGLATLPDYVLGLLFGLALGTAGALIVARHPRHPVGWIFLAAFCYGILNAALQASILLLLDRLPEVAAASATILGLIDAYYSNILNETVWFSLLIFPILYFPTGRLPSRRWRYFLRLALLLLMLFVAGRLFNPDLSSELFPDFQNPFSNALVARIARAPELVLIFATVIPPVSLLFRFRRAQGVERQQIKWPLFSALLATIGIGWIIIAAGVFGAEEGDLLVTPGLALEAISVLSFPISISLAIVRYRLYEIDIIISRTLQYLALTVTLALVYFGSVILLQRVFPAESPVAVVASTLAVAALFAPLRRRLQNTIDRRFYRQKYDAQQTLAAFGGTIRDEVDLDRLSDAVLQAVAETLHPAQISLWLRDPQQSRQESHPKVGV